MLVRSDIPHYLEGWEDNFEIPKYFETDTVMTQLHSGIITDTVKNRVTQEVLLLYHYFKGLEYYIYVGSEAHVKLLPLRKH